MLGARGLDALGFPQSLVMVGPPQPNLGGSPLALQGSLDTFALPDVLRLLATTAKTGRLRVEGDRGQGSVWLRDGTVMAAAADRAVDDAPAEEVLFELLRFEQGAFAFEADELSPNGETPEDVEILLRDAGSLLTEWGQLEQVVPSLDHKVDLVDSLPKGDVTIEASRWPSIVAVASGRTVREVATSLGLSELGATRAMRDLVDLGVATVGEPSDEPVSAAAELPPEDRARRSPFGSLGSGEQLATALQTRDTGETGWLQSPERAGAGTGTGGSSMPDGLTSGVSGIGRSGTNGSGSPAPGLTPRSGRSGSAGKRTTSGSNRSSGTKRSGTAGRSPGSRRDSTAGAGSSGAGAGGAAGATGSASASGPGESRRSSKSSRDGGEQRRSAPSGGHRDPSGEFRRSTPPAPRDPSGEFRRPTPSAPRDPSGEFRRPTPSAPRDPSGEFRRPSAPRDPSGEFRRPSSTGPGYESRSGKSRPTSPRRSGNPGTPPPVLPDTGPLSMPPVSPTAFDAGPLGPSPLPADTGQIRPVSPSSLPPDLQWAVDDQTGPGVPPAGPLGGRGLGNGMGHGMGNGNGLGNGYPNGNGAPGNGYGNGNGAPAGGVPLDPHKVAPHVAAMSPEARAAVQGTVGNTGGASGGFGPGDDLASRGQLLNFLSSVRP
jgi:hypothetical protein